MRILAPRVHVEVFRPTKLKEILKSGKQSTKRVDPKFKPNELRYIRTVKIEDRRIKGIQFEETALFGGFIEINIAEDPQSELFDNFLPNDHVEVFYDDEKGYDEDRFNFGLNIESDYDFVKSSPKFQGASWKTDLKYRPSMVTTQLHAWDYLRILQYINIPRGIRKERYSSTLIKPYYEEVEGHQQTRLKATQQRQQYGDDMLDYIDGALNAFLDNHDAITIFGQEFVDIEIQDKGVISSGLQYSTTGKTGRQPLLSFYNAGIGEHCQERLRETNSFFSEFNEVFSNTSKSWSQRNFHKITSAEQATQAIELAAKNLNTYDILQFRFLDGDFRRFNGFGLNEDDELVQNLSDGKHYVADIIIISQFALIELLLKKLTIDHGLNQWFTPVLRIDSTFLDEIESLGQKVGNKISKLIYVRLREVNKENSTESTIFSFNIDTYPFVARYTTEAFKLAVGNLVKNNNDVSSNSLVDIFIEIFTSINFPQPKLKVDEKFYSIFPLSENVSDINSSVKSQQDAFNNLSERFTENFSSSTDLAKSSSPELYLSLMKRITNFSVLIQKSLSLDDKIISYIRSVPASYMRADIYTGSKFNTIQYDSLAITRIIQLIVSSMSGFPSTNAPQSNTEKGKIDSYPIFAANRIVIKPRVYFGIKSRRSNPLTYKLYPSLSELFKKEKFGQQGNATCFLMIDVAKKKLKEKDDPPEFEFPMEEIQDFGMIKASTVNHYFNFSIDDNWKDFKLIVKSEDEDNFDIFKNVTENGILIEYVESNLQSVGFSPPEHQQLKLTDLTQKSDYTSWSQRFVGNTNVDSSDSSKPIFNPLITYVNRQNKNSKPVEDKHYIINNYDNFSSLEVILKKIGDESHIVFEDRPNSQVTNDEVTIAPFHGITSYCDISDLKAEYTALDLILNSKDISYRDISNVDLELMENIKIRAPLKFEVNLKGEKYKDKINFIAPGQGAVKPKLFDSISIKETVSEIKKELDKINDIDMIWLFPHSGYDIDKSDGNLIGKNLDDGFKPSEVYRKHLFLLTYLDLLVKGIRYIIWSLAKARFFCHVYLPIDYSRYAKRTPSDIFKFNSNIVEPGSSVQIKYDENNTLFKSIKKPLVAFPITGLGKDSLQPLYQTISRGSEFINVDGISQLKDITKTRTMTWYVSKKVTYIGADTGAMMRVEMTEGSLDWTLFYNEKNLLTQVSEHYLLNGLGNFRTGGTT